jgi:hypothetical protein
MSDASDSEPCERTTKMRHRAPDNRKRSKEKLKKYYESPEKQARLQERIRNYEETIIDLQNKVKELKTYVISAPQSETQ